MSTSPKAALLEEFALVARALSAPHRLAILEQLAQMERSVEALAGRVNLTVANCSQHLQQLRRAGLVTSRREGKQVIYRLSDDRTVALMDMIVRVAERNLAEVDRILRGLAGGETPPEPLGRDALAEALAEGSVVVLDLRPVDEFTAAHIPGARNVRLEDLEALAPDLKGREIVAYCRGGYCVLAHQAVTRLRQMGLAARRLDGGLPDWRAEGRPVIMAGG